MFSVLARLTRRLAAIVAAVSMLAGFGAEAANNVSTDADQVVGALAYAPQAETLYKSDGQALYRSEDGGRRWMKVPLTPTASNGQVADVAVSAVGQGALYVAGPGLGVLKSVDAGKNWIPVGKGLPSQDVIALATHSTLADTLYAVVAQRGVYRSEDGGERWRMVDKGPQAQIRRLIHSNLEGSMQTGWMFAATEKGVYRSMDCFCGWRIAGTLPGNVSAVAYDPKQPMQLYAAVGRQVFSTANGGEEWRPVGSPDGEVHALAYSASGVLYALLADGRVVHSRNSGKQWE